MTDKIQITAKKSPGGNFGNRPVKLLTISGRSAVVSCFSSFVVTNADIHEIRKEENKIDRRAREWGAGGVHVVSLHKSATQTPFV